MERWSGKVAVVTGASAGIGAAFVKSLLNAGLIVVGLARRNDKTEELKNELPENLRHNLHAIKCDVTVEEEIIAAFSWVEENLGGVDVLINNAGILRSCQLVDPGNTSKIKEILDVNVMGVVLCTREAFQSMKKRGVNGHIILINSVAGHKVIMRVGKTPSYNIYPASKHAVTAMTESLRQEFMMENTKIKITSVSPGAVRTEIFDSLPERPNIAFLEPEDIVNAVLYVLGTPPHVQVHELMIKPMGEMF